MTISKYPNGKPPQPEDLGHAGGVKYGLKAFREDVGKALRAKFGADGVTAGSKAFDVHSNTARLDADVAVFLEHHRYTGKQNVDGTWHYLEGVEMRGKDNSRIIKESVLALDKALQKELNNSLESLGRQLAALSNRFVEDYLPLTEKLREVVEISKRI